MYAISQLIRMAHSLRARAKAADVPALPPARKRYGRAQTAALALLALLSCVSAQAQQRSFINLGFEEPVLTPNFPAVGCNHLTGSAQIPGWETTHSPGYYPYAPTPGYCTPAAIPGPTIELWVSPFQGISPRAGRVFSELNASENSRIYQNICMVPGEEVSWRFSHRGRGSATNPDVADFNIGPVGGTTAGAVTIVRASTTNIGTGAGATNCVAGGTCSSAAGPNGWRDYSGVFTWTGAGGIQSVGFEAISSGVGNIALGNFIDEIQVNLTPFVELTQGTYTTPEGTPITVPTLRITGTVPVAMQVPVTITGGTAVLGTDYTTPSGTTSFFVTIPAGEYPPTEIPLGLVSIGDGLVEDNLTVNLQLEEVPADYTIASTQVCGLTGQRLATWNLLDDDVDVLTTKSASTPTPESGVPFTYTVTYLNNTARPTVAPLDVHDVAATVTDAVPTGVIFTAWTCQASNGAACPGGAVNGSITGSGALTGNATLPAGNAAAGGLLTYQITAVAAGSPNCTSITNTSTIALTSGQTEANGVASGFASPGVGGVANNTASADIDPTCPVVEVAKFSDPADNNSVVAGQLITYSVNVTVSDSPTANVLTLTDTLSGAQTFVTGSFTTPIGGNCSATGQVLTCTLPTGATIGTHTFTYQATIDAGATGTVGNVVVPSGPDNPTCPVAADCDTTHTIAPPVVTVSKSSNPADGNEVTPGQTLTYTVSVVVADAPTNNVLTLTDTLSGDQTLIAGSFTTPAGGSCTAAGLVLTCILPAGATVGSHDFTYQTTVDTDAIGNIGNVVVPTGPDNPTCPVAEDCDTTHRLVPSAVIVTKSSNPADGQSVLAGQTLTYMLNVEVANAVNSGIITLTDTLSGAQSFVTGSFTTPAGGSCTATGQVLTCTLAAGAAVGTHAFTYQTTIDAGATGNIGNVVVPSGPDDPACPTAGDCDTDHEITPPVVAVSKSSDPADAAEVAPGQTLTYTVSVVVADAATNNDLTLTDTLSGAQTFVAASFTTPAGGSCNANGQVLTCTLPAGAAVGAHVFTYQTTIDADASGMVGNVVVPTGTDNPTCPVAEECDTTHTIIPPMVTVAKSADPADGSQVEAGQTVSYSLTVTVGNAVTTGVVTLTDTLSAGLSLVDGSFTTPTGASCAATGQTLTCALPAGATVGTHVFTYQALVVAGVTSVSNVVVPSGPDNPSCQNEDDCTTLHPMGPVMTVIKTSLGAPAVVAGTGDEFTVRYSIVVSNVGGSDGTYQLVDAPQYESDASIVSATAMRGTDSLGMLSGTGPWALASNRTLTASSTETYTLEVRVRIAVGQSTNAGNNACVANTGGNGLFNLATLTNDGESTTSNACVNTPNPVLTTQLVVEKVGSTRSAEIGDVVSYSIRIRNTGGGIALLPVLVDRLPAGFRLVDNTARVRGATLVSLQGAPGPVLNLALDRINPGAEVTVAYRVRLGVGSMQGDGINRAHVECRDVLTTPVAVPCSNTSTWKVDVNAGVFTDEGCVVGQVFVDCNYNSVKDKEELGIPGVRMYFENGTYMVSDSEGKYSYCGLRPTTHVLKVDSSTLPTRSRLVTSASQNVGDANSLFVDLKNGELHRADFIEGSCNNEVIEQVKVRKAQGEISSVQTESDQPPLKLEDKQAPQASSQQQGTDSANQILEKVRQDD